MWNDQFDTEFMTAKELMDRLRLDLGNPAFFTFDLRTPSNESDYQEIWSMCQILQNQHKGI